MKKLLALLLALMTACCAGALAETEGAEIGGIFVLMTIPYDMFYEAETTGGQYDSVSSATCVKPLMMKYSGGSFHFMPDGREITGVIFPVLAESEEMLAAYGGEEITAESSVTITVVDEGQELTTTYTGSDALFQSYPFSYCRLSEAPAVFKRLNWDCTFGAMEGLVIPVEGAISLVDNEYAEVCLQVEGVADVLSEVNVNAVVLVADDGTRVGMKHVENIWQKTLSGFNLDSWIYAMLKGKTVTGVDIYTFDAKYAVTGGEGAAIN